MSIYTRGVRGTAPTREESGLIGSKRPLDEFKEFSEQHIKEKKEAAALKKSAEYERMQQEAANLEESRKQAEELVKDAEKRAKEQRERASGMSDKVDEAGQPEKTSMYNSHFEMVQEFAEYLSTPAVIMKYASSPEGEIEFNNLVNQLIAMSNDFEAYYKETYGTSDDGDERYTFKGSENRMIHGVNSIDIDDNTLNIDTDHQEMMARLTRLDTTQHTDMRIENGKVVFFNESGDAFDPLEDLDMEVFYPETSERPPMSGAQYLESTFDPDYFTSAEDVERHIRTALSNNSRLLRDAVKGYIERMQDINPSFEGTISSVIDQDPDRLETIKQRFIDDAVKAYEEKTATTTPTEPEVEVTGEEEVAEAQAQEQAANQSSGETTTDEEVLDAMAREVEEELGVTLTEEEKQALKSEETRAFLRQIGLDLDDMWYRVRGIEPPLSITERYIQDNPPPRIKPPLTLEETIQKVQNDRIRKFAEDNFDEVGQLLDALDMGLLGGGATTEGQKKLEALEAENEAIRRHNAEVRAQEEEFRKQQEEFESKFSGDQKELFGIGAENEGVITVNETGAIRGGLDVRVKSGYIDDQNQPYRPKITKVSFDPMEMAWTVTLSDGVRVPIRMSNDGNIDSTTDQIPGVVNRYGRKASYYEMIEEAFNSEYGRRIDGQNTFLTFLTYLARKALQ